METNNTTNGANMENVTLTSKPGKLENSYNVKNGRKLVAKISGPSKYSTEWLVNVSGVGRYYASLECALESIRNSTEQQYNAFGADVTVSYK